VLDQLLDPDRSRSGLWPEFVLFDCHACHHAMSDLRWAPRSTAGLGPGAPRLNDSSFLMLSHALAGADPGASRSLRDGLRRLHLALSAGGGDASRAARSLRDLVDQAIDRLAAWDVQPADALAIAKSLVGDGTRGEFRDYASAEQSVMALQSLATTLNDMGALDDARLAAVQKNLEAALEATDRDERYRPDSLGKLLQNVASQLR
jgi:hypothetical protein